MRCLTLTLHSFRSYAEAAFAFAPRINLLHGANGVGKTNVVEALSYLGLGKSFLTHSDQYALRRGAAFFEIHGSFEGERRGEFRVRMRVAPGEGKLVWINGAPLERLTELVGRIPMVLMTPQDHALTSGPPEERRRFLNTLLSQAHPVYLDDLVRYNRALRQRNELLGRSRARRAPGDALMEAWTDEVATLGGRVVEARRQALARFAVYLQRAYELLDEQVEHPRIAYGESAKGAVGEPAEKVLRERLHALRHRERETGRTLVGPHRDDLAFSLDEMDVRRYASQGQHRTFGIALRLAQFLYLREQAGETPLLLLDDLFGHLDGVRRRALERLLLSEDVGQSIVTDTEAGVFTEVVRFGEALHRARHLTETLREPGLEA